MTVVAPGGNALLVLGVGTREQMVEIYESISAQGVFWDARPNRVVLGGIERTFRPLGGKLVIGCVESGDLSVILCQVGGRVGVVAYEGGLPTLVFVSAQGNGLGVADIDTHRLLTSRARPSRHHLAGPCDAELSQLIARALHDLAARASTIERPKPASEPQPQVKQPWATKRVGKRAVGAFADLMIELGVRGCGDLGGTSGVICEQINTYFPGRVVVAPKKLSQVLWLVQRAGTCFIERPTSREWLILIGELRRPGSQLLKRFLAECSQTSALSLPSSTVFEGVVVRPRANSVLGRLHEKLAAASRSPSPNSPPPPTHPPPPTAGLPPLDDDLLKKLAGAARPPPPTAGPPTLDDDLLKKLAAAAHPPPPDKRR